MAVVFLIGGTGNQLFQYASAAPTDTFSTLFLQPWVRKMGWTKHPILFTYPKPTFLAAILAILGLALDLGLWRLTGITLFSELDLRRAKSRPWLHPLIRVGYFQTKPEHRSVSDLASLLPAADPDVTQRVCLHIRGGDLLAEHASDNPIYGILPVEYYRAGLFQLNPSEGPVHVFTDDPEYARKVCFDIDPDMRVTIDAGPLHEMFTNAVQCRGFVASNSTLSYWILRLRGDARASVAPSPFQNRRDMALDVKVIRVPVAYQSGA